MFLDEDPGGTCSCCDSESIFPFAKVARTELELFAWRGSFCLCICFLFVVSLGAEVARVKRAESSDAWKEMCLYCCLCMVISAWLIIVLGAWVWKPWRQEVISQGGGNPTSHKGRLLEYCSMLERTRKSDRTRSISNCGERGKLDSLKYVLCAVCLSNKLCAACVCEIVLVA